MKKITATVCAIAATALLASSTSFADDRGRQNEYHRGDRHGQADRGQAYRGQEQRFDQRDGRANDRRPDYNARGPEYRRGGRLPNEYRSRTYEVDYREHHLQRPPAGHHWVQVGADYVLVAIATGVIANIILNH